MKNTSLVKGLKSNESLFDGSSIAAVKFDSKKKALHDPKRKEGRVQQQRAAYTEELSTLKAEEVIALDEMGAAMDAHKLRKWLIL
jgi:hypothetical protein